MNEFEQQWQRRFEKFATRHLSDHQVSGWSLAGLRQRMAAFERLVDEGLLLPHGGVLDVGCGAGTYVRLLAKRGHPVVGLDYSIPSLARARAADVALAGRYAAGGAYALPFGDGSFDGVVCIGVFQALERVGAAVGELARVLRPAGIVVVETLNPLSPVAAARRVGSRLKRQPSRLRYSAPSLVEAEMVARGIQPTRRIGILLPPRSLPWLENTLMRPGVARLLTGLPGVRSVAPHAFWIVGVKTA